MAVLNHNIRKALDREKFYVALQFFKEPYQLRGIPKELKNNFVDYCIEVGPFTIPRKKKNNLEDISS